MRACLLAGVLAAALSVCATARAHEDGGLGFPGAKRLTISLGDDGSATATVLVGNTTTAPVLPTFSLFLRERDGGHAELAGAAEDAVPVPHDGAQRYRLRFGGAVEEGATGHLAVTGAGRPGTIDVEVARAAGTGLAVPGALALVLALALVAAAVATLAARRAAPAR